MEAEKTHNNNEEEKRSYFRIDDVIPVVVNPLHIDKDKSEKFLKSITSSKAFSLMGEQHNTEEIDIEDNFMDSRENQKLYDMIVEIKAKLDFVINHFMLEKEGFLSTEKKLVNISASGIRFTINHPVNINDIMEIKLLLPTYPPVAIFAYGEVKRVKALDDDTFEIALEYINMGDSVRNEIIQYTLSHQRETIRRLKETGKNE